MLNHQRISAANLNILALASVFIVKLGCTFRVPFRYYRRIRYILTAAAERMIGAGSVESLKAAILSVSRPKRQR